MSDRIIAQHLLPRVDINYGDLELYYMAEARGNHNEGKDGFSSCQVITWRVVHQLDVKLHSRLHGYQQFQSNLRVLIWDKNLFRRFCKRNAQHQEDSARPRAVPSRTYTELGPQI